MKEYIEPKVRYIDIKKFTIPRGFFNQDLNVPKIFDLLYSQPTADVVEVVRCKDCEYGEADYGWDGKIITPFQYHCEYEDTWNRPDHYCGYGKRR